MKGFLIFAVLIAATQAALSFSANIRISGDPSITGILTGTISYTLNSYNQFDTGNNYKISYNQIGGGNIYEILKTVTTSGTNQNIRYLVCGTSCDAQTYSNNFPTMQYDTARFPAAGFDSVVGAYKFTRAAGTADVTSVWFTSSTGGTIVQAQFGNGKVWAFTGVTSTIPSGAFNIPGTVTCPTPTCTVVADIVQVIDDSGSIGTTNFRNAVMPFAVNICNSYDWAVSGAAGITMAGVFFSTSARTILAWTTSKASAVGAFNNGLSYYTGGNTCITCGINQAVTLFNARLSGRSSVSKLVFFMTDGYANVGGSLYTAADASKAQGITTVAIGVGSAVSQAQINYIASTIPGVQTVFQVSDFNSLANIKNSLVGVTCTTFQGSPCGNGCQGFCSCGSTCICPQCDASNLCLTGSCTAGQYSTGCTYQTVTCDDGDACTSNACNPSTGCQFTNISSSCNSANNCKITGCSAATGCVSQDRICTSTDPCKAASCNPSVAGGCVLTDQTCDTCKIPIAGGRSANNRPCPDPDSILDGEKPDGNQCKDWYCDPADFYVTTQYPTATPTPVNIGRCKFTLRTCSNNMCTNNTCVPSTGLCNSVDISSRCDDGNPCTRDSCDPTGGCVNTPFVESDCYYLTGGLKSQCFRYVLNTTDPVCCQAINISEPLCKANYSDKCLDWQCLDQKGCDYFTKDCEKAIGVDKITDCYTATCTNETGCLLSLIDGKKVDSKEGCGLCVGTAAYNASSACTAALTVSEIAAISAGVIAAIIIAIVVICLICGAVGGKVGLDYYRKYKGKMSNLQSNPLYEDKQKGGVNPFYQESEMSAK